MRRVLGSYSMQRDFRVVIAVFVVLIISLCVHEFAHGWVATKRGDPTPKLKGRLTLNPLAHADLIGTLLLPIICLYYNLPFIGWAKPVPVDPQYFKGGRRDMAWVSLAGPGSNLALSLIATLFLGLFLRFGLLTEATYWVPFFAALFIRVNLSLAFFNVLPIPPLDGFMFLVGTMPQHMLKWVYQLSRFGFILILILFFTDVFDVIVKVPTDYAYGLLESLLSFLTGN